MTNLSPANLRLHVEEPADEQSQPSIPQLVPLFKAFEQATGWELRYEQSASSLGEAWSATIGSGAGQSAGRLVLASAEPEPGSKAVGPIDLHLARPLALSIANLVGEFYRLREALVQREAELAAGVPVQVAQRGEPHLAERLEAVIKGGAEAVGCQAAGLYLLNDDTSELKLRASWGLPSERLLAPARPLRGAVADLEALVGHAVVLEDTSLLPHWRCPEEFPSAVCVPVSSPTLPLGTFWIFSERPRDFSPQETNLLEIVAGRLAADLEREMLLASRKASKLTELQLDGAALWATNRLPSISPILDNYEVAGWTKQAGQVGGDFHDWSVLADGRLALIVGDADGEPMEAALSAASLQAAVRAHSAHRHTTRELLERVNESLLAASPGDLRASLGYALLDPDHGHLDLALAGRATAVLVEPEDWRVIAGEGHFLGAATDAKFTCCQPLFGEGNVLALISGGVREAVDAAGLRIGESALATLISNHLHDSAAELARRVSRLLDHSGQVQEDLTVLILKRLR